MTLPPLSPGGTPDFSIDDEGISDLFDGTVNKRKMLLKLDGLIVERENRKSLLMLYNNETMDRCGFRNFVEKYGEIDGDTPDEIFSCATGLFSSDDGDELPDRTMTKREFTTAFIRVANLWTLMNEGMADSSELASQTQKFISHCSVDR